MPSIGCLGAGYWGPNLIRNVAANPDTTLVALCDTSAEALQRISKDYPAITRYQSFENMLKHPNLDAVLVATPSGLHFEHAMRAL